MYIVSAILIVLAALIIVAVIRHTRSKDYTPSKPKVADERLTLGEAKGLYADGGLTTHAGYLHYDLSEAYEVDDKLLGVFIGYVKPDPQHDGDLIVYDDGDRLRGKITGQRDYYAALLNRRRANCYGYVKKSADGDYSGEACIRNI